jgi:hypothetical protein
MRKKHLKLNKKKSTVIKTRKVVELETGQPTIEKTSSAFTPGM